MEDDSRIPGRPRDEAAGPAILEAARTLVLARGYNDVSVSEIIRNAGVSRQTLYRRWSTKADLVLDAFFDSAVSAPDIHADQTVRAAVLDFLIRLFAQLNHDGGAIRSLIAAAVTDPEFGKGFQQKFVAPRERMVIIALEVAKKRGELPGKLDVRLMATVLHGAFWYRLLNEMPLNAEFAEGLVGVVFKGPYT